MYDADACWSDVNEPRMIPQGCYPQQICDAVCGMCEPPADITCVSHRCGMVPK